MVNGLIVGFDDMYSHLLHFGEDVLFEVIIFGGVTIIEVPLELRVGQLVGWLKLLIILGVFLDGIVGEMYKFVVELLQVENLA